MQINARPTHTSRRGSWPGKERAGRHAGEGEGPDQDWLLSCFLAPPLFIQVYGGYFIHYFAPRGLQPVEKNVVFVIDVSGSMFGTKLQQVTRTLLVASEIYNSVPFKSRNMLVLFFLSAYHSFSQRSFHMITQTGLIVTM